jgi:hypothetical protein
MATSPHHATPDRCSEAVKRKVKFVGENEVCAGANAGSLKVHIFHNAWMNAVTPGKVDHRRSMDWQAHQSPTLKHGGNSQR